MRVEDKILFNEIKKGNKVVYESLFNEYYESLVRYAEKFIFDQAQAEDLVQELFIDIWDKARKINITTSIKSYFYQAVRNRCLNYLKSIKVKDKNHMLYIDAFLDSDDDAELFEPDIIKKITESIDELPEQMAHVFRLKLKDGLKQDEIALELNISVNSVKTHLKRARVKLREALLDKTNLLFLL
ncbi:RNA polymerase sigma-70 factor [Plebeiibacterium marinum]|uniref:RNA polymerase sigma-70 factor n=1 Tax=Plebeiibacterium marinum TaxID=2992111 RepID=A0AAE3MEG1_9BACT|nr:RNA polymerase sigma-70 factor [Plebeiobacterium marinum]MCW3805547.1 RNA polymerase sigma-70 factor [Plebeiobacterium marinum]